MDCKRDGLVEAVVRAQCSSQRTYHIEATVPETVKGATLHLPIFGVSAPTVTITSHHNGKRHHEPVQQGAQPLIANSDGDFRFAAPMQLQPGSSHIITVKGSMPTNIIHSKATKEGGTMLQCPAHDVIIGFHSSMPTTSDSATHRPILEVFHRDESRCVGRHQCLLTHLQQANAYCGRRA